MTFITRSMRLALFAASCAALSASPVVAQTVPPASTAPTYADLVALAEGAPLVLKARIKDQAVLKPERAPNLAPGFARLYVEAQTQALLAGNVPVGESLRCARRSPATGNRRARRAVHRRHAGGRIGNAAVPRHGE